MTATSAFDAEPTVTDQQIPSVSILLSVGYVRSNTESAKDVGLMKKMLYLLALLSTTFSSSSFGYTGNELLALCEGNNPDIPNQAALGMCVGYIVGVTGLDHELGDAGVTKKLACIPRGRTTYDQLTGIVVKALRSQPEYLHHGTALMTLLALSRAFPCE